MLHNCLIGPNTHLALASTLVHVASRVVEDTEHGNDAVRRPVGAPDVAVGGTDVMNCEADAASVLGDDSTVLKGIIDAADAVLLHRKEKAGAHLGARGSGVEEGGGGMGEVSTYL